MDPTVLVALITGVVGIAILPWKLTADPHVYIYVWLGVVGGLLGTVAGVLIADYWALRRTRLQLADLYRPFGAYWYTAGWNWRAVAALLVGGLLAVGGSYSGVDSHGAEQGPFPVDGMIPFLKPLADYGWAVGFASASVVYLALSGLPVAGGGRRTPDR